MNPTAIINPDDEFHIMAMPNPTRDAFYIEAKGVAGKKIRIQVFDELSQQIETIAISNTGNELMKEVSLISRASGIYLVQINVGVSFPFIRTIQKYKVHSF